MGSASKGCRENNTIMAKAAANSRYINRRGRVRTASRPSYIGIDWTPYDEGIENKSESTRSGAKPKGGERVGGGAGERIGDDGGQMSESVHSIKHQSVTL
jgi:hypothetical protein